MIHLHRVLSAAVICLALAEFAGAQVSPPPIPQGLKKVGATIDGSAREKIQALVVAQFNRMVSPDAKADVQKVVREAREALAMEAKDGTQPASPEYQAAYAEAVVEACEGNKTEAAKRLGIGRNTLARLLRR